MWVVLLGLLVLAVLVVAWVLKHPRVERPDDLRRAGDEPETDPQRRADLWIGRSDW